MGFVYLELGQLQVARSLEMLRVSIRLHVGTWPQTSSEDGLPGD